MAGRVYDYGRPRGTAKRLIGRFGVAAELRQGGVTYLTTVTFVDYRASEFNGTNLRVGDFKGLIAASDVGAVPTTKGQLYWEGREREIVSVQVVKPGPDSVLYTLQLRGPR